MSIINIVVRVDGDDYIGTGHIYRCLNLVSYINNSKIIFICKNINDNLKELIKERYTLILIQKNNRLQMTSDKNTWLNDSQLNDCKKTIKAIRNMKFDWIIIDHYGIGEEWEKNIKPYVKNIFVIDDYIRRHNCDVLLNILLKNKLSYDGLLNKSCYILHDKEYTVLNKGYLTNFTINNNDKLKRINIFMGGVDKTNETVKIINKCHNLNTKMNFKIKYDIIIGCGNENKNEIIELCNKLEHFNSYFNIKNIKTIFLNSELSISLAGNTIFEKCILQLPSLLICTDINQRNLLDDYIDSGVCLYMGNIQQNNYLNNIEKNIIYYYENPVELKTIKNNCNNFFNKTHLITFNKNINLIFNNKNITK